MAKLNYGASLIYSVLGKSHHFSYHRFVPMLYRKITNNLIINDKHFLHREVTCAKWFSGAQEGVNAPISLKFSRIGAPRRSNAPKYGKDLMIGAFEALSAPARGLGDLAIRNPVTRAVITFPKQSRLEIRREQTVSPPHISPPNTGNWKGSRHYSVSALSELFQVLLQPGQVQ